MLRERGTKRPRPKEKKEWVAGGTKPEDKPTHPVAPEKTWGYKVADFLAKGTPIPAPNIDHKPGMVVGVNIYHAGQYESARIKNTELDVWTVGMFFEKELHSKMLEINRESNLFTVGKGAVRREDIEQRVINIPTSYAGLLPWSQEAKVKGTGMPTPFTMMFAESTIAILAFEAMNGMMKTRPKGLRFNVIRTSHKLAGYMAVEEDIQGGKIRVYKDPTGEEATSRTEIRVGQWKLKGIADMYEFAAELDRKYGVGENPVLSQPVFRKVLEKKICEPAASEGRWHPTILD